MAISTLSVLIALLAAQPVQTAALTPVVSPSVWQALADDGGLTNVWVFLRDKGLDTPAEVHAAIQNVRDNYDARAIRRRQLRRTAPGLFDERDIPVNPQYVRAVRCSGAEVRVTSPWLNAVSVRASASQIEELAALDCVARIEPVRRGVRTDVVPIRRRRAIETPQTRDFYGLALDQLSQIGIVDMHNAGYTGAGIVIGVLDTGFRRTHVAYTTKPINMIAEYDFLHNDPNTGHEPGDPNVNGSHGPVTEFLHGTIVLSQMAAYAPNELIGGAYDAGFILAKTEDTFNEYQAEEDLYVDGLQFVEANGADVASSSLGYIQWYTYEDLDGLTAVTTVAVNTATDNGLVCVTGAGNGGQDQDLPTLIAPSDAFDVITVGAVNAAGDLAGFSSIGPTADGRIKPEVLARGEINAAVDPFDDTAYTVSDGTSLSTPLVASAVALLLQAHPTWGVQEVRTALFETADYFVANGQPDPLSYVGYGVIDVFAASQVEFCDADLDGNGAINLDDLTILLQNFGSSGGVTFAEGDIDGNDSIDLDDLTLLLQQFGRTCAGG